MTFMGQHVRLLIDIYIHQPQLQGNKRGGAVDPPPPVTSYPVLQYLVCVLGAVFGTFGPSSVYSVLIRFSDLE